MRRFMIPALALVIATTMTAQTTDETPDARAKKILEDVPLIDGHNDVPWELRDRVNNHLGQLDLRGDTSSLPKPMHTDIPRLQKGQVGGQFWSVYVPVEMKGAEALKAVTEQIDVVLRMADLYPETFAMAYTADDIVRIHKSGRIASLIGVEGGHSIASSLATLRVLHRAGARYMTITHSSNTDWADSATDDPAHDGLTPFGRQVIGEMNRLGMLVDLSHTSEKTMNDVLDIAKAPVIFSHSSSRALCGHPRNVPDAVLERLVANDGIVMVTFVPPFLSEEVRRWYAERDAARARLESLHIGDPTGSKAATSNWRKAHPEPPATLAQVADHIDHIREIAGIDHIGIGSDFDGTSSLPVGLEDVSHYPELFVELLRRGYSEDDLRKIAGLNVLRVMRRNEERARELQAAGPASDARIDELDAAPR